MSTLRKILETSLGAALMTEEGLRELKEYLSRQLARIIHEEIRKALEGLTVEVKIKRSKQLSK